MYILGRGREKEEGRKRKIRYYICEHY